MRLDIFVFGMALLACACSDSDASNENDGGTSGGDDGGASGGITECTFDAIIDDRLGEADAQECGRFAASSNPDGKELAEAESCAIEAFMKGEPFVFVYEQSGISSIITDAYVFAGGSAKVGWYGNLGGIISLRECDALEKRAGCVTQAHALCLSCVEESASSEVCTEDD